MKFSLKKTLLIAVAGLFSLALLPAKADVIGFTGAYDVSNWTTSFATTNSGSASLGEGGSVDTSGAPNSVALIEPDCFNTGCNDGFEYGVQFWITAATDSIFTFDYDYSVLDGCCSGVYVYAGDLNTPETGSANLSPNGQAASGTFTSTLISAGDIFGWGNFTNDDCCGANVLTITNFSVASTSVPEPGALILLSLGLFGVALRRKRLA